MTTSQVNPSERELFNLLVSHPLQSYEWGEFREKTGIKIIRKFFLENNKPISAFQLSLHKVPKFPFTIGYLPKGNMPSLELVNELKSLGKTNKSIFIQLEPNVIKGENIEAGTLALGLKKALHPLFTKYTFQLDLTISEDELLKNMHPKTRYNIRVAQKHGVIVSEDNSNEAFEAYLELSEETTKRQKFYAHSSLYHKTQWEVLGVKNSDFKISNSYNKLTSHLLIARYKGIPLVAWILFVFKDTLYYPYGASSSIHKEVMASNLMMFEAIKFGKKLGLKKFDMWGALGEDPNPKDPWIGFHRFKKGYGPKHIEFVGSFDEIIDPLLYKAYSVTDKLRWMYLRLRK